VALWRAPVANLFTDDAVQPSLLRLFELWDRREQYTRAVRRRPMVTGSQGQPVAHALRVSCRCSTQRSASWRTASGSIPAPSSRLSRVVVDPRLPVDLSQDG
jgi:hypothetical protein